MNPSAMSSVETTVPTSDDMMESLTAEMKEIWSVDMTASTMESTMVAMKEWRLAILMVCSTVEHLDRHSGSKRGNLKADRMGPLWEQLKEQCSVAYLDSKTASRLSGLAVIE